MTTGNRSPPSPPSSPLMTSSQHSPSNTTCDIYSQFEHDMCTALPDPSSYISTSPPRTVMPRHTHASSGDQSTHKKRAASFGGADYVKARPSRRASHHEKHVRWADEKDDEDGEKAVHHLTNVKVIRPRISLDTINAVTSLPGHSILHRAN